MFITSGGSSSIQRKLYSFYREVSESDFNIRYVTKVAFSQARRKLKPGDFIELNDSVNKLRPVKSLDP